MGLATLARSVLLVLYYGARPFFTKKLSLHMKRGGGVNACRANGDPCKFPKGGILRTLLSSKSLLDLSPNIHV